MSWPDQCTPAETDYNLIQKLLDKMISVYCDNEDKKIVIHCRYITSTIILNFIWEKKKRWSWKNWDLDCLI